MPLVLLAVVLVVAPAGFVIGQTTTAEARQALFVQGTSNHSFSQTVNALKLAVSSNAEAYFNGNTVTGKKLFGMSPAVGAALPVRIYVWEAGGKVHVSYYQPSALLASINPKLGQPGKMLDQKFAKILQGSVG